MTLILLLLAALSAGASVVLIRRYLRSKATSRRIASYVADPAATDNSGEADSEPVETGADQERLFGPARAGLAEALELADIQTPADRFALNIGLATFVGAVLFAVLIGPPAAVAVLAGVPLLAWNYVSNRRRRRRVRFADQLADSVQAIAAAMRAGQGLPAALSMVADDAPEPMATELQQIVDAERLGVPLEDALETAVRRTGSRDLENLGLVAALQRDVGGNGAEALDRIVDTIRQRDDLRRLVTTLTAQGRMSRWVLTALPLCLAGVLLVIGGDFLAPLWEEGIGRLLAVGAIGLIVIGSYWIKRIVEIEV